MDVPALAQATSPSGSAVALVSCTPCCISRTSRAQELLTGTPPRYQEKEVVAPKQQTVGDTFKKRAELAAALAAEKKARETLERLLEESPQKGEGADGVVGPSAGKGVELEREERMRKAREKLRKEKEMMRVAELEKYGASASAKDEDQLWKEEQEIWKLAKEIVEQEDKIAEEDLHKQKAREELRALKNAQEVKKAKEEVETEEARLKQAQEELKKAAEEKKKIEEERLKKAHEQMRLLQEGKKKAAEEHTMRLQQHKIQSTCLRGFLARRTNYKKKSAGSKEINYSKASPEMQAKLDQTRHKEWTNWTNFDACEVIPPQDADRFRKKHPRAQVVPMRWVDVNKADEGEEEQLKSRLVVREDIQKQAILLADDAAHKGKRELSFREGPLGFELNGDLIERGCKLSLVSIAGYVVPENPKDESVKRWLDEMIRPGRLTFFSEAPRADSSIPTAAVVFPKESDTADA
eukprot:g10285.t1